MQPGWLAQKTWPLPLHCLALGQKAKSGCWCVEGTNGCPCIIWTPIIYLPNPNHHAKALTWGANVAFNMLLSNLDHKKLKMVGRHFLLWAIDSTFLTNNHYCLKINRWTDMNDRWRHSYGVEYTWRWFLGLLQAVPAGKGQVRHLAEQLLRTQRTF